jgi:hypothetical protein
MLLYLSGALLGHILTQTRFTSIDGQDRSQPLPYDPGLPVTQQVSQSIQKSLSNLGVEYIDSVVLHSPLNTREVNHYFTRILLRLPISWDERRVVQRWRGADRVVP